MKKRIIMGIIILSSLSNTVFAGDTIEIVKKIGQALLNAISWLGYAIALGILMLIGLKYITSPAKDRADLKHRLPMYFLGMCLMITCSVIAGAVAKMAGDEDSTTIVQTGIELGKVEIGEGGKKSQLKVSDEVKAKRKEEQVQSERDKKAQETLEKLEEETIGNIQGNTTGEKKTTKRDFSFLSFGADELNRSIEVYAPEDANIKNSQGKLTAENTDTQNFKRWHIYFYDYDGHCHSIITSDNKEVNLKDFKDKRKEWYEFWVDEGYWYKQYGGKFVVEAEYEDKN